MCAIAKLKDENKVCDIGSGVVHLTILLADRGLLVSAVEPNDAMRTNGIKRTAGYSNIKWLDVTAENLQMEHDSFEMVTFGSSFNVTNRHKALILTSKILKSGGWFACMWNRRVLGDPIRSKIEAIIRSYLPDYDYGTGREDQTEIINNLKLFKTVIKVSPSIRHIQNITECIEAWQSYATLQRQAHEVHLRISSDIGSFLKSIVRETITIPYETNIWMAQKI
ncbi:ubiquinone/menaquinone biosynthesis methyltransferase [Rhodobacteraceae bacterium SB2]|nr:ubiquinone/menaquinone biosynthesis methyltransferase [Rhodobacteraceae bacterium SB2]